MPPTESRNNKKNPIWPPGGHFENDIAENGQDSTHVHNTQVLCCWSLELIFKAKLKLESGNQKNPIWLPDGHFQSDIAKIQWTSTHTHQ